MIYILKHAQGNYQYFAYNSYTRKRTMCHKTKEHALDKIITSITAVSNYATIEECITYAETTNNSKIEIVATYSPEDYPEYFI